MIAIIVGVVFSFFTNVSGPIDEVRNQFLEVSSIEEIDSFIKILEKNPSVEAEGYHATMLFMKSKFVKFPLTKYNYFKKGKSKLDDLISGNSKNIELRYLRFILQSELPKFLGYNANRDEDFKVISIGISQSAITKKYKVKMLNNMLLTSNLEANKNTILKEILNKI